jgi:hypothetical protein
MANDLDPKISKPELFVEHTDKNRLFLESEPRYLSHSDVSGNTLSNAQKSSPNYSALRGQFDNAMHDPDAAACVLESGSGQTRVVATGGSQAENLKAVQKDAQMRFNTGAEAPYASCGPAKDFLKPRSP